MSLIRDWSTTPANNELTVPYGAPTNWYPSDVSKTVRQHMADHRTQWEDAEWFNWGHEATQASGTTFTVATNLTAIYQVGRRLKIADTTTLYGTITASSYSAPNTTVTMQLDSGSLTSAMNGQNVFVSILSASNQSIITIPPGFLMMYAAASVPGGGFLWCNGQAVSRTTYPRLFAVISTTWGTGDGSTTFNVPDFRGEFIRGFDGGRGVDVGRVFAAAQAQAIQAHTHTQTGQTVQGGVSWFHNGSGSLDFANANTGSTGGTETRPRNNTAYVVIKT